MIFKWSSGDSIGGMNCVRTFESAEPVDHTSDNYFCAAFNYQFYWSSSGSIEGKTCEQIVVSLNPNSRDDNYLCVDTQFPYVMYWRSDGCDGFHLGCDHCVKWEETPHPDAWDDNYLCFEEIIEHPTEHPTTYPTEFSTQHPTAEPTEQPTEHLTDIPIQRPTENPTENPCPSGCGDGNKCHDNICVDGTCEIVVRDCDDNDDSTFDMCDPIFMGCYNPDRCLDILRNNIPFKDPQGRSCAGYTPELCARDGANTLANRFCCICGGGRLNIQYAEVTCNYEEIISAIQQDQFEPCNVLYVDSPDDSHSWEGEFTRVIGTEINSRPVYCEFTSSPDSDICLFYAKPTNLEINIEGWVLKKGFYSQDWLFQEGYREESAGVMDPELASGQWKIGVSGDVFQLNIVCASK